jgi:hypothetical protein
MSLSREHHGDTGGIGDLDHGSISDRSPRLDHCGDPGIDGSLDTVREREERIRGER